MNKMMSFFAGIMSGLVVGAVTAILLAPSAGSELQSEVQNRIRDVFDEAKREQEATETRLRQEATMLGVQIDPKSQPNGAGHG